MKRFLVAAALCTSSLVAQCDADQPTFEQALANAKKNKQLTLLAGIRIKGDDTTPQAQFDAIVDRIAECLSEQSIQDAFTNCPFLADLNLVPGLSGSFFFQATDHVTEEEDTTSSDQTPAPAPVIVVADTVIASDVEIASPCSACAE